MTVREVTETDAARIQEIARESWHAAYEEFLDTDQIDELVDSWYDPQRLRADNITDDSRPFFVAVVEETIVGFAEAVPEDSETGLAKLYRIYVAPEYWQEGIGKTLLDRIESVLTDRGFERLRLSVFAENTTGVEFYEAMGFERVDSTYREQFDAQEYEYEKEL